MPWRMALGLGLSVALGSAGAQAQDGWWQPRPNYCPPPYHVQPHYPPHMAPTPTPTEPAPPDLPDEPRPEGDQPMGEQPMGEQPMDTPQTAPTPEAATPPAAPTPSVTPGATGLGAPSVGTAGGGPGGASPMFGRLDSTNRFNIFDNMSAIPQSRVWFSYIWADGIAPGVDFRTPPSGPVSDPAFTSAFGVDPDIRSRYDQHTYRFGIEYALSEDFSIAAQGQYITASDNDAWAEDFTSPEILFKYVLYRDCANVISGTLGYSPEVSPDTAVYAQQESYIYPGVLVYQQISQDVFVQAASQV
ncbi:MAG: hypothetical protein ACREIV_07955, partial [Planctomycetaceae bacterium]